MDPTRFDAIARFFAERRRSRKLPAAGASPAASAQDATPPAVAAEAAHGPAMLFLQAFQSGSIAPKVGEAGTYTLTLAHGLGQTISFSDRPERTVGAVATPAFLVGLGFSAANPPNAALLLEAAPHDVDVAVLELFRPRYDTATNTATYDVRPLRRWEQTLEMGFAEQPTDLSQLHPTFGSAHLFIDGCADGYAECYGGADWGLLGTLETGDFCWSSLLGGCAPCVNVNLPNDSAVVTYWSDRCNAAYAACDGGCLGTIRITGSQCPYINGVMTCPS